VCIVQEWELDSKHHSGPTLAGYGDLSLMGSHNFACQREAESSSLRLRLSPRIEKRDYVFVRYTNVGHMDFETYMCGETVTTYRHRALLRHDGFCMVEQVEQRLAKTGLM
jgi:hypothetical protein